MQERMNRIFGELPEISGQGMLPVTGREMAQTPYVDVLDRDNEIVVTADLPGVDKKDIQVNIRDDTLEISAEKRMEKEHKEEGYLRRERGYNRFYRAMRLPVPVDQSKARASFNNGVLEITLPKMKREERKGNIPIS